MVIKNSTPWLRTDAIERMNDDCSKHAILDEDSSVKSPTSITNWNMETAPVLNSRVAPPWSERRHWKHGARNQREMRVELNVVNWVACFFVCCYFICKTVFEFFCVAWGVLVCINRMSRFQVEPTVAILDECFDTFYCGPSEKVIMLLAQLYIDKSQTCHNTSRNGFI